MVALLATVRMALSFAPQPSLARAAATGALLGVGGALASVARAALVLRRLLPVAPRARPPAGCRRWSRSPSAARCRIALYAYAALVVRGHDVHGALAWIATAQHGFVTSGGAYRLADAIYGAVQGDRLVAVPLRSGRAEARSASSSSGSCLCARSSSARCRRLAGARASGSIWRRSPGGPRRTRILGVAFFGADPERWIFVLPAGWILGRRAGAAAAAAVARRRRGAGVDRRVQPGHRDLAGASRPMAAPEGRAHGGAAARRRPSDLPRPLVGRVRRLLRHGARRAVPRLVLRRARRRGRRAGRASTRRSRAARARGGRVFCVRVFDDADEDPRGFWELGTVGVSRAAAQGARSSQRGQPGDASCRPRG